MVTMHPRWLQTDFQTVSLSLPHISVVFLLGFLGQWPAALLESVLAVSGRHPNPPGYHWSPNRVD